MLYNILSLFDGISCGRVALERANIDFDAYFASEVDESAIKISSKNYPDIIHIGDVRNIDADVFAGKVDLMIGGSPCQNFTFSGRRKGMATESGIEITTLDEYLSLKSQGFVFEGQSYLFWEYARLLKKIKPKYFLLENVKMERRWQDVISRELGVEPILINSNLVSAQNRQRLYWTNIPNVSLPQDKGILLKDILDAGDDEYPLSKKHYEAFLKSYPNWKPCDINGKSKPLLASYYKQPPHCPYIPSLSSESGFRRLSPVECERLQTLPDNYTEGVSSTQRYKTIGNGWTVDVIAHILSFIPNEYDEIRKAYPDLSDKEISDILSESKRVDNEYKNIEL